MATLDGDVTARLSFAVMDRGVMDIGQGPGRDTTQPGRCCVTGCAGSENLLKKESESKD